MSTDHITPRIDATLLQNFVNQTVRIIGRVDARSGNQITFYVPSCKQTNLTVPLTYTPDLQFEQGTWYEVIGRVNNDLSVRSVDAREFKAEGGVNEKAIAGLVHFSNKVAKDLYGVTN